MSLYTVGIGGEPATGKTTLMRRVLRKLEDTHGHGGKGFRDGLLRGIRFNLTYVLGIYDEGTFAGTDRLSMAVQTDATTFLRQQSRVDASPVVLFEGDRLFNHSFLTTCEDLGETAWFNLTCPETVLTSRHARRQDTQTALWLKGRRTKILNVKKYHEVVDLPTGNPSEGEEAVYRVWQHVLVFTQPYIKTETL